MRCFAVSISLWFYNNASVKGCQEISSKKLEMIGNYEGSVIKRKPEAFFWRFFFAKQSGGQIDWRWNRIIMLGHIVGQFEKSV